jgi:hypothetical protein
MASAASHIFFGQTTDFLQILALGRRFFAEQSALAHQILIRLFLVKTHFFILQNYTALHYFLFESSQKRLKTFPLFSFDFYHNNTSLSSINIDYCNPSTCRRDSGISPTGRWVIINLIHLSQFLFDFIDDFLAADDFLNAAGRVAQQNRAVGHFFLSDYQNQFGAAFVGGIQLAFQGIF